MMYNTEDCVELAINTAPERNLKHIVVISSSSSMAGLFRGHPELNVACIFLAYCYGKDGGTTMAADVKLDTKITEIICKPSVL